VVGSRAKVTPQKLKSAALIRTPSRQVEKSSRLPSRSPVVMSIRSVIVENVVAE